MPRKKPCDFCAQEQFLRRGYGDNATLEVEWYPDNEMLSIYSAYTDDHGLCEAEVTLDIKYCPMCGRKLEW